MAPGKEAPQRVLQCPVALVVVSADYARFYGVVSGLSVTTLTGTGWAVGVMCAPAAGTLLSGDSMGRYTDRYVDLADVLGAAGKQLPERVRAVMAPDPHSARTLGPWRRSGTRCARPAGGRGRRAGDPDRGVRRG